MLKIENISYIVEENGKQKKILNNVSFVVKNNKTLVITGKNGSGKSTLAKIIMGLIKPTSGNIFLDDKNITNLDITERANLGISYAFQRPITFKGITVQKLLNVASSKSGKKCDYCDTLFKVGLCAKEYMDRFVNDKLSGGELKRIELATIFARKSKVNIFDEPEAGIDLFSFNLLVDIFKKKMGSSIIISHHKDIIALADDVIVLSNGKIEDKNQNEELYINTPNCVKKGGK